MSEIPPTKNTIMQHFSEDLETLTTHLKTAKLNRTNILQTLPDSETIAALRLHNQRIDTATENIIRLQNQIIAYHSQQIQVKELCLLNQARLSKFDAHYIESLRARIEDLEQQVRVKQERLRAKEEVDLAEEAELLESLQQRQEVQSARVRSGRVRSMFATAMQGIRTARGGVKDQGSLADWQHEREERCRESGALQSLICI